MNAEPAAGRVAFLGSDVIAARCLAELADAGLVRVVVTPPARRRSRRSKASPTPVAALAAERGLACIETADVNTDAALASLRDARPELLVVVSFGQFLRRPVREVAPAGAINLHFSALPRWRGASPVQRAIAAGDEETGVAIQRVVRRLDAGPVLLYRAEPIGVRDTTPELQRRLTEIGAPLLRQTVERILASDPPPETEQDEGRVTLAPLIDRDEGRLDFAAESAVQLDRRVRAFGVWPGCRVTAGEAQIRIHEAWPEAGAGEPGVVLGADAAGVLVGTRDGVLRLTRLQRPGGKPLDAADFLNGFPLVAGGRLAR